MNTRVFDWVEFPEGRARFSGGVRGADQAGHETFALELHGKIYYGEISAVWADQSHFNLRVDSFGHLTTENVGMPLTMGSPFIENFPAKEIDLIQSLVVGLVKTFWKRAERPFVMEMDHEDQFLGKVEFKDGWVQVTNESGDK